MSALLSEFCTVWVLVGLGTCALYVCVLKYWEGDLHIGNVFGACLSGHGGLG